MKDISGHSLYFTRGENMGDTFSNQMTDQLINDISGNGQTNDFAGSQNEKVIRNYNFKTPQKFTKDDLKIVREIYEIYSRLISSYLTGVTRLYCQVKVLSIEEQRYGEFSNTLEDYEMMGIVNLGIEDTDISETECTIQLANSLTFSLVERMMGGAGSSAVETRDFTEIEVSLLKTILEKMATFLQEAWASYIDISPSLSRIETNTRLSKSYSPDDIIVLAAFEVELNKNVSVMTINIPAVNMEEIMSHFTYKYTKSSKRAVNEEKKQEQRATILSGVRDTSVDISAVLAQTRIELSDIISLQVNDIIPLDVPITQNAAIKVNNVHWFNAKPGVSNNKKAVKIVEICKH